MKAISCCGIVCSDCEAFSETCRGCRHEAGAPFWVREIQSDICPLYAACAVEEAREDCGCCRELSCEEYLTLKDPAVSDEEHAKHLKIMVDLPRSS
ncbi:hypothetical protein C4J81_07150 [Deltaproteobacteria bacterium Smac51]|nr:hypothetical protein C4J81_07150 [Deltaproteobacteria bacterium Smac51]